MKNKKNINEREATGKFYIKMTWLNKKIQIQIQIKKDSVIMKLDLNLIWEKDLISKWINHLQAVKSPQIKKSGKQRAYWNIEISNNL